MPIDLEMLLSATSHPLFGYPSYTNNRCGRFTVTTSYGDGDTTVERSDILLRRVPKHLQYVGSKSSFETKDIGSKENSNDDRDLNYNVQQRKKRVSFADDVGLSLVEIRTIPESSPRWADDVLSLLMGGTNQSSYMNGKPWKLASPNPPWNDDKLLELLELNKIAVESVSVSPDGVLSGKIKVKNLAFEKAVFLRVTYDRWMSYADVQASYTSVEDTAASFSNVYDIFTFDVKIQSSAYRYEVVEFCAGFKCCGEEYWDNNGGINYRLVTVADSKQKKEHDTDTHELTRNTSKVTLSVTANFDEYSEIHAWNRFMYDRPYW